MSAESFKRKLTAILSADVKGYSRLMGENEAETVKTLTSYRKIMGELIQQHRGRVIDSPGDNILAEFASVVDAVQCAVAAQNEFKARNAELPENRRMEFRVGVNLGDVIEEEGRIYGDGVNIAARLEALAEPGGICISKTAFDYIENKLPLGYQFLGQQTVKNIAKPVGAYKVLMEPRVLPAEEQMKVKEATFWRGKPFLAGVIAVLFIIIGVAVWNFYLGGPKIEPASKERMAFPLPNKPSIVVLPFTNMSDDPKQELFCDGLTENLITALSKTPKLFVIASNTSFTYKGKPVKVRQVCEELGVLYVLEGSIQKSADRQRITAQLVDGLKGNHIWSERYDGDIKDLFAVQDDITKKIITAVQVELTDGEMARLVAKGTSNLNAYLKVSEALWHTSQTTKEGVLRAEQLAEEAIALDANYGYAYMALGNAHGGRLWLGITPSPQETLKRAIELNQKAVAMDQSSGLAHGYLAYWLVLARQYDRAVAEGEKAIAIDPSSAPVLHQYAAVLTFAGKREEAIPLFREALRLNPKPPNSWYRHFGVALRDSGRYEEAITVAKKAIEQEPKDTVAYMVLASACQLAGREEEAREAAKELLRINPAFSLERLAQTTPHKDRAVADRFIEALRRAGLK